MLAHIVSEDKENAPQILVRYSCKDFESKNLTSLKCFCLVCIHQFKAIAFKFTALKNCTYVNRTLIPVEKNGLLFLGNPSKK
jgi:hypothetical protein